MFRHPLAMNEKCPHCHHQYDKGNGYFLGAMYGSYTISLLLGIALVAGLVASGVLRLHFPLTGMDIASVVGVGLFLLAIGPMVAFPYSRLLWVWAEREGWLHDGVEDVARLRREAAVRAGSEAPPPILTGVDSPENL